MNIAILGGGPTSHLAPLGHPDWEVWGCNALWRHARKDGRGPLLASRWFELHPRWTNTPEEQEAVLRCPVPIYVLDPSEWGPPFVGRNLRRFPLAQVTTLGDYFTCTFAYEIALALVEGATAIGLYGVHLPEGSPRERVHERACVEWWMGYAEARGVTIHLPPGSMLGRARYRYGYDYAAELAQVKAEIQELDDVIEMFREPVPVGKGERID